MIDENEYALNKYMDEQERNERMYEAFEKDIQPALKEISDYISEIKSIANNYGIEDWKYYISDLI